MQMTASVSFTGQCEDAFRFYEQNLGGELGPIFRYGGSPMADRAPAEWVNKVMHGSVRVGGQLLMGADVVPEHYEAPKGFSLSLNMSSVPDAERIFQALAAGGHVIMPLEETFWAARFGQVVDRFGIPWQINCEAPQQADAS